MSKYGVLVMGPAGAGKSTFCASLVQHLQVARRSAFYVNLDPAAESFAVAPDADIRELVTVEDVMEELGLGPNGALLYCFEFLLSNLDFLTDALDPVGEDCLVIFDMPGQIELYTHVPLLPALVRHLATPGTGAGGVEGGMRLCATYLLEASFVVDRAKFFAGALSAMSAMVMLEMPHVNVLSKMDQVRGRVGRKELGRFAAVDVGLLDDDEAGGGSAGGDLAGTLSQPPHDPEEGDEAEAEAEAAADPVDPLASRALMSGRSFRRLNRAVAQLLDDFALVSFLRLDVTDEDSVGSVLAYIDDAIQFHDAQEPREPADENAFDYENIEE